MKTKRGLRVVSFLMVLCMLSVGTQVIESKAATGTIITISTEGQVVDTFNGVSSLYRPGSWDGTDSTYGCHAYVMRYYQAIYGKSVYNMFHNCVPQTYGDSFVEVKNPQPGDICAQIKKTTNHWSIVKQVSGSTVTVIDQNNKWVVGEVTQAYKNYTYDKSEVTFYRLASLVNGTSATTTAAPATTSEAVSATTTQAVNNASVSSAAVMNVNKGKKKKITSKYVPVLSMNPTITWKSSKKKVAKVSKKGYVTGVKKGSATITGTLADGQKVSLKVRVKIPATSLKLVSNDVTIPQKTSWQMTATMKPNNTTDKLTFTSSNPSIATVSSKGVVQSGSIRGMTIITVKTSSGKKKQCIVRVY
ncbi:MAG: Ig-like domain-containing protein [Lachnospiraceae bacterium]|nr:Ig-like domain-containing protein [Lachnospiraceae bacterium]